MQSQRCYRWFAESVYVVAKMLCVVARELLCSCQGVLSCLLHGSKWLLWCSE